MHCAIDWLNGVLRRFQQYFSHITATVHIIHVFPGFHQYQAWPWSVLPKDIPTKKPRRSSAAQTQDPWNTSQTLSHEGPALWEHLVGFLYPHKTEVFGGILQSACLSVRPYVRLCTNYDSLVASPVPLNSEPLYRTLAYLTEPKFVYDIKSVFSTSGTVWWL